MGSLDATVATVLVAFPTVTAVLLDPSPVADPLGAIPVASPLHAVVGTVASLGHVVVDAGIGVAVGIVLVALYVVALRRDDGPEHTGDDRREKPSSSGRENHDP